MPIQSHTNTSIYSDSTLTKEGSKQKTNVSYESTKADNCDYSVAEARNIIEVKTLLAKGFKYEMDYDGIKLFTKNRHF